MLRTLFIAVLCVCASLAHAQRGGTRSASQLEWREDLDFLAERLPEIHPDPWAEVTEQAFRDAVFELRERMPFMSEGETTFEICRVVAMLGDQNTTCDYRGPMSLGPILPVQFVMFEDGLYVNASTTRYSAMLGARMVSMGGIPVEDLTERAAQFFAHDNETTRRQRTAELLVFPAVLKLCGVQGSRINMPVEFEIDGETRMRQLTAVPFGGTHVWTTWTQSHEGPVPASYAAAATAYTSTMLGDTRVLYAAYNRPVSLEDFTTEAFAEAVVTDAHRFDARRIVLDLRFNAGAEPSTLDPVIEALAAEGWLNKPGGVVVLIGRLTAGSALEDAERLRERGATLVGVPTGGNPSGLTGARELTLPNSRMRLSVSTHAGTPGGPTTLTPDLEVAWTGETFFAMQDPALDAAVALGAETDDAGAGLSSSEPADAGEPGHASDG